MSLFQRLISDAIESRKFLDVGRGRIASTDIFGKIVSESGDLVCLERYNDDGQFDGIAVLRKDDITYVGFGGNQRDSTEKLVLARDGSQRIESIDLNSLENAIRELNRLFGHVAIYQEEISEDFYLGELLSIDSEFLLLCEFGTRKSLDRLNSLVRLDTVTRIEADGIYERNTIRLFQ